MNRFEVGSKVNHKTYGSGTVVSVEERYLDVSIATIKFDNPIGQKYVGNHHEPVYETKFREDMFNDTYFNL